MTIVLRNYVTAIGVASAVSWLATAMRTVREHIGIDIKRCVILLKVRLTLGIEHHQIVDKMNL